MKICVLGNSHAGALKRGWDSINKQHKDLQITFFASRADSLKGLVLKDQALVPATPQLLKNISFTSEGKDSVRLNEYDIFLLFGLEFSLPSLDKRLSSAVKTQACLGSFTQSLSFRLAKFIRSATSAPIYIGHNPQRAVNEGVTHGANQLDYSEVLAYASRAVGIDNTFIIRQPDHTLANGWNTKLVYSKGSVRLDLNDEISNELHPDSDVNHMNGEFGRTYLECFLATIEERRLMHA